MYSPSPWISKYLVDKLINDNVQRSIKNKQRLNTNNPNHTGNRSSSSSINHSNGIPASKNGKTLNGNRSTNVKPLSKLTYRKRGRSSMRNSDDEDNHNKNDSDDAVNDTEEEDENDVEASPTSSLIDYNSATFYAQLCETFLQPVTDAQLNSIPSTCCRESILSAGPHYRLKDRIDFSKYPNLRESLLLRHRNLFLQDNHFDFENILNFFEYKGGECGKVMLCTIHDPLHPLSQVAGAGNVSGTFAREPIKNHEILGMYPGVLMPMASLDKWMAHLPVDDRRKSWMYDLTSSVTDYSYHGMGVRNVLAGINDYHGIDAQGASVKKVSVKIGGILPVVFFVAARDINTGEELTLKYGEAWVSTFMKYFPSTNVAGIFQNSTKREVHEPRMIDILASITLGLRERTRHGRKTVGNEEVLNRVALANVSPSRSSNNRKASKEKTTKNGTSTITNIISSSTVLPTSSPSLSSTLVDSVVVPGYMVRLPALSLKVKIEDDQLEKLWDSQVSGTKSNGNHKDHIPNNSSQTTNGTIVSASTNGVSTNTGTVSSNSSSLPHCITPRSMYNVGKPYHSGMGIAIENCSRKESPTHSIFWERQTVWQIAAENVIHQMVDQQRQDEKLSTQSNNETIMNNVDTGGKKEKGSRKMDYRSNVNDDDNESVTSKSTASSNEKMNNATVRKRVSATKGRKKKKNISPEDTNEANGDDDDNGMNDTKEQDGEEIIETKPRKRRSRKTIINNDGNENRADEDEITMEQDTNVSVSVTKPSLPSFKQLPELPCEASELLVQINLLWKTYLSSRTTDASSTSSTVVLSRGKRKNKDPPMDERLQIILTLLDKNQDFHTINQQLPMDDKISAWITMQTGFMNQYKHIVKERQEINEYNETVRRMYVDAGIEVPSLPSSTTTTDPSMDTTTDNDKDNDGTKDTELTNGKSSSKWKNTHWCWEEEDRLEQQVQSRNNIPTELEILTSMFLPLSQRTRHAKKSAIATDDGTNETGTDKGNETTIFGLTSITSPTVTKNKPGPKKSSDTPKGTSNPKPAKRTRVTVNNEDKEKIMETGYRAKPTTTGRTKTKKNYWVYVSETDDDEEEKDKDDGDHLADGTIPSQSNSVGTPKPLTLEQEIKRISNDSSLSRNQRKQLIDLVKQDYNAANNNGNTGNNNTTSNEVNTVIDKLSSSSTVVSDPSTSSVSTLASLVVYPKVDNSTMGTNNTFSSSPSSSSTGLSSSLSSTSSSSSMFTTPTSTTVSVAAPIKPTTIAEAMAARKALAKLR